MILLIFVYKYLDARSRLLSIKNKLIIGTSLASLTMCISGAVEGIRQKYCPDSIVLLICIDFI
jgi:hypothetical protein